MVFIALVIAVVSVGIDQLIKYFIDTNFELYDTMSVIKIGKNEIFNLTYVRNNGAGWSIFSGKTVFLVLLTSVLLVCVLIYLLKYAQKHPVVITAIGLILGGGIGNLIDRIFRNGSVIDYIDARFIDFPVFNFADICVVIGSFMLIIFIFVSDIKKSHKLKIESEKGNE